LGDKVIAAQADEGKTEGVKLILKQAKASGVRAV
jgi:hypothetical protein